MAGSAGGWRGLPRNNPRISSMTGARNSAGSAPRPARHQRLCRRTELRGIRCPPFTLAQTGVIRIDISDAILDETIRVQRDKFGWDGYRLHDARLRMASFTNRVTQIGRAHV